MRKGWHQQNILSNIVLFQSFEVKTTDLYVFHFLMKPQPFCLRLLSQKKIKTKKIFNDGYLGSHNDEERSKVR